MSSKATDLPKAITNRIIKNALPDGVPVSANAKTVLAEATATFIHMLSATANDYCKSSSRSIISTADVLSAIEDLEHTSFLPVLKDTLEEYSKQQESKKSKKPSKSQSAEEK